MRSMKNVRLILVSLNVIRKKQKNSAETALFFIKQNYFKPNFFSR